MPICRSLKRKKKKIKKEKRFKKEGKKSKGKEEKEKDRKIDKEKEKERERERDLSNHSTCIQKIFISLQNYQKKMLEEKKKKKKKRSGKYLTLTHNKPCLNEKGVGSLTFAKEKKKKQTENTIPTTIKNSITLSIPGKKE